MTIRRDQSGSSAFDFVPPYRSPGVINAIVEIPKGRRSKFELDKLTGLMKLDRYLYSSSEISAGRYNSASTAC